MVELLQAPLVVPSGQSIIKFQVQDPLVEVFQEMFH